MGAMQPGEFNFCRCYFLHIVVTIHAAFVSRFGIVNIFKRFVRNIGRFFTIFISRAGP